jgi:hypothetical protein
MTIPTGELIRRYQAGQADLFEAIFDRYKDYVYRVAYSLIQHAATDSPRSGDSRPRPDDLCAGHRCCLTGHRP